MTAYFYSTISKLHNSNLILIEELYKSITPWFRDGLDLSQRYHEQMKLTSGISKTEEEQDWGGDKLQFWQKAVSTRGPNIGTTSSLSSGPTHAGYNQNAPRGWAERLESEEHEVQKVLKYERATLVHKSYNFELDALWQRKLRASWMKVDMWGKLPETLKVLHILLYVTVQHIYAIFKCATWEKISLPVSKWLSSLML